LQPPRAGLFVTCLVDLWRPSIGFAAARLIEATGCTVVVPEFQTCCGQPAFNSGDRETTKRIALQTMRAFTDCDYVVVPSGSCAAMLKVHYPKLLQSEDAVLRAEADAFAGKVHELCTFLTTERPLREVPGRMSGAVTYHDACSGLRELGIKSAPRRLLELIPGLEVSEMREPEACCGFGGLFATKYADISVAIASRKIDDAAATGAGLLLSGDLGCLMHLAGRLSRQDNPLRCRHVAEVLADELSAPPIGHSTSELP
jgi:L-lactate dehydrogenase complex protein LldE